MASPFDNISPSMDTIFNPDAGPGTFRGTIGSALGIPSRVGTIRGQALQALNDLQSQGLSPQQAVVKYLSSPDGANALKIDPGLIDTIQKNITAATPPQQQITTLNPGQTATSLDRFGNTTQMSNPNPRLVNTPGGTTTSAVGPNGETSTIAAPPPDNVQTFQEMGKIANLPTAQLQKYAESNLMVNGRYSVVAEKNAYGEPTGQFAVFDRMSGQLVSQRSNNAPSTTGANAVSSDFKNPDGSLNLKDFLDPYKSKASMFLGTGLGPAITSTGSAIMGSTINPALGVEEGRVATQRKNYLNDLDTALASFPQNVGRSNIIVKQMLSKVKFGITDDPLDATRTGLQIYNQAQGEITANENLIKDPNQPKDVKVKAAEANTGWQRVLRALPSQAEMQTLDNLIVNKQIPGMGIGSVGVAAKEGISNAITGIKNEFNISQGTGASQQNIDIPSMPVGDLIKVDPTKLNPQQRLEFQARLRALTAKRK